MDANWILNELDEIVYVADVNTYELLFMNDHCLRLTGMKPDTYHGKKCYAVLQGRETPCPFCNNASLKYGQTIRWEFLNPYLQRTFFLRDKKVFWDNHEARIEFAMDVTGNRLPFLDAQHRMASLIRSVPGGICMVSADSLDILWHNDRFLELIGYTEEQFREELDGKARYVHPEDLPPLLALMEEIKRTPIPVTREMRILRRDGTELTLMTTLSYLDLEGEAPVFYSVGIDITPFKFKERQDREALRQALKAAQEASVSKSQFLSRMSHEIRTPLNVILGMTTIAESAFNNRELFFDAHKKTVAAARYLLSLINDVLDMARIETGKMLLACAPFSFPDLVSELVGLFAAQAKSKDIRFRVHVEPLEEEWFEGDALRLKQVLVNLLTNALKFTSPGGSVHLHIRKKAVEGSTITLEMTVADTGIGISPKFIDRLFHCFEQEDANITTRYGGSGLGLAISKYILDLMGATIQVRSREGKGSTFSVAVPLTVSAQGKKSEQNPPDLSSRRVLVADASGDGQNALLFLREMGGTADLASTGREALLRLGEACRQKQAYTDIIMSDPLPDMSCTLFMEQVQSTHGRIRCLLAAYQRNGEKVSGKAAPCGFVQKPFFRSTFRQMFSEQPQDRSCKDAPTARFQGKRLLVAEDNELNMEITSYLLHSVGFEIVAARNGEEAVEKFRSHGRYFFDGILMDIRMPVMDGLAATAAIRGMEREDAKTIPIIALSANAFEEDRVKSQSWGMSEHITKPMELDVVCAVLERFLGGTPEDSTAPGSVEP